MLTIAAAHKAFPAMIKALPGPDGGEPVGEFEALVSVFGNKDRGGDVVEPGAFSRTLAEWNASGDPIPIYYSHRLDDPDYNIGSVIAAEETSAGLRVRGLLDLEQPKAATVYRLMKGRRLTQFSFSYSIRDGAYDKERDAYLLKDLELFEVGPTPVGQNPATALLAVKAVESLAERSLIRVTAGQPIPDEDVAELRKAHEAIGKALAALPEPPPAPPTASSDGGPAKAEEPDGAKAEEPSRPTLTAARAAALIHLMKASVPQ